MKRISAALAACILVTALAFGEEAKATFSKDETVYAILDPSGAVKSVIVSDWVHSERKNGEIRDRSDLTNIENVKGKDLPKRVGNELVWSPTGNDVYYRGTSTKNLPFSIKIAYWLDGKTISPVSLAGKSGKVRIRIEVKNLAVSKTQGSDAAKRIYAPLAVIIGTNLQASVFHDIEVSGGTIISDGQNNIAAGILLPGLLDSITAASSPQAAKGIEDLPESVKKYVPGDSFEISANVTKFAFGSFMVAASPSLPDFGNMDLTDKLQAALDGMVQLGEASAAIRSGSAALADGAAQLHAGVASALGSVKPMLEENRASIDQAKAFIGSDGDIAAAREMLAAGERLAKASPGIKDILTDVLDPATKQSLSKMLADAKNVDTKTLLDAPLAGSIVSEDKIAAMAEALQASDDLFGGFDEGKLAAIGDFAAGSPALLTAVRAYDDAASGYSSSSGAALLELAKSRSALTAAEVKVTSLGAYDAQAAAVALDMSSRAQADFALHTAFLDDSSRVAALKAKLGSGSALSKDDLADLSALLDAASGGRAEAKAGAEAAAGAAKALPALADAAASLPQCLAASAAAEALSKKVLPALESAKSSYPTTKTAVAAATKMLDPKTVTTISTNVHKIGAAKKAYAKNKSIMKLAHTFLVLKSGDGGFKKQMAALEALQKDAASLSPLLDKVTGLLESDTVKAAFGPPDQAQAQISSLLGDIETLSKYFGLCNEFLSEKGIGQARDLVAKLPELESGVTQLDTGSAMLAEKLGELAAGTAKFDDEGIKTIVSGLGGVGRMALGYLKATDAVAAVSKDYSIFTQAPSGAKTSLKYILRTEEIK
jgi:hypothetical protein